MFHFPSYLVCMVSLLACFSFVELKSLSFVIELLGNHVHVGKMCQWLEISYRSTFFYLFV